MFTKARKIALTALVVKGTRPDPYDLEALQKFGYVDDRGRPTPTGTTKAYELLAVVEENRRSDGGTISAGRPTPNASTSRVDRQG